MASSTDHAGNLTKKEMNSPDSASAQTNNALDAIHSHLKQLCEARPTALMGNGKADRTRKTIEKILKGAYKVFSQDGHAGFSLRKVASEAGIAVGNLTYHFPTKDVLIAAMIREALSDYVEEHLTLVETKSEAPLEVLLDVVEFYVRNGRDTHPFFFQLWGFAGSGDEARALVRELYRPIGRLIFYLVRAANPKLTADEASRAVLQICSLEEGYKMFIGLEPADSPGLDAAEKDIRTITKQIVTRINTT